MGFVYFIACEPMEAVKIGYTSSNPFSRMSSLQTGCPSPLKLLAFVPGSLDDERRLHECFQPLHIQGEWFRNELKLRDLIFWMTHETESPSSTRQAFENGLHDVLMQDGGWYPYGHVTQETYSNSASWHPFHDLLEEAFGPSEEA